jgi:hypothetical protein
MSVRRCEGYATGGLIVIEKTEGAHEPLNRRSKKISGVRSAGLPRRKFFAAGRGFSGWRHRKEA